MFLQNSRKRSIEIALAAFFIALGVVLSPFTWFQVGPSKANPTQHMINVIVGIMLGPLWSIVIAFFIGIIRISLGTGTIFAIPGGLPGGFIVGLFYHYLFKRMFKDQKKLIASFTEPIGTVLIGATVSIYLVAPLINTRISNLIIFYMGWLASSATGSVIGFIILTVLYRTGYSRENILGKP
ncbi:MAG: energy coupling factor transporter S component ThiW [Thermoprotei archaeon]